MPNTTLSSMNHDQGHIATTPAIPLIADAAEAATRRIAPLWPLKHFVAVNPFLGLTGTSFVDAAHTMAQAAGARLTMPRSFYLDAISDGRITDADLTEALADVRHVEDLPRDVLSLKTAAGTAATSTAPVLPTVADAAATVTDKDWSALATDRVSAWASSWFDKGQAAWTSPRPEPSLFAAWRAEAGIDRTPEVMGLAGFRRTIVGLPDSVDEAVVEAVSRLGLPGDGLERYFHRLLMTVGGWASYARYQVWESELYGGTDSTLSELLAVRLAWDLAILEAHHSHRGVIEAWQRACTAIATGTDPEPALAIDCVLQSAYERAWQRQTIARLAAPMPERSPERMAVQAAFCIDVRSEVFRRALESMSPKVETIGFAGFFGFPIEYVPLGQTHGGAQCPVLLTPKFTVCEAVKAANEDEETEILGLRLMRRRAGKAWKSFKLAAVSSFAFVETMGWTYLGKLATDGLGLTRTVPHPSADGIDSAVAARLGPQLAAHEHAGRITGFTDETRVDMAEAVLKAMSMTSGFARLVLLAGHGSTTVNNPHATGLDCGACGGHTGEANARVAAAILNDRAVAIGLRSRGIELPEDTVFLGGLHDTTTDEVAIFDEDTIPASHSDELARLKQWLWSAAGAARAERAALLNLRDGQSTDAQVVARSRDWSQVRPEWGLAGCAAFVAAPRSRTAGLDFGGRSFLHSYHWRQDEGFGVLELIMTAPMVVASWISLQYYGSTVDNRVFGCGNKVLHNVVGTLGVLEGNGGDLRVGLPWQSVHDGKRLIHEPLRLSVFIEAPIAAMNDVIAKHAGVRQLVDNGWLYLFALDDTGAVSHRYNGGLEWTPVESEPAPASKAA